MLVELIAKETGAAPDYLRYVIQTASRRYRTYEIQKRTGGVREINHPTPLLKFLQRWVVRNVISHLPVHSNVTSYQTGGSILRNASAHVAQNYLLKMDFQDFFPSITSEDVKDLLRRHQNITVIGSLSAEDETAIVSIVCRDRSLTIGAPSSPAISNAILYEFDTAVFTKCKELGIIYTRYADDLSFSTNEPNTLIKIPKLVGDVLARHRSPRLRLHNGKTISSSRKHRKIVTGLVLTPDKKVSIGRKKKRWLKSTCFKFKTGQLDEKETSHLRGYLSFVQSVEPDVVTRLKGKFGVELIDQIVHHPLVNLKAASK